MTHFEIDVPTAQIARFDRVLDRFVAVDLLSRPEIDVQIARYSKEPGVERRSVFLSNADQMAVLLRRLHEAVG